MTAALRLTVERTRPHREAGFYITGLALMALPFAFFHVFPVWQLWRDGLHIKGTVVDIEDNTTTVVDPETERSYKVAIWPFLEIGDTASVFVLETNPAWFHDRDDGPLAVSPQDVYLGLAALLALVLLFPWWAITVVWDHCYPARRWRSGSSSRSPGGPQLKAVDPSPTATKPSRG